MRSRVHASTLYRGGVALLSLGLAAFGLWLVWRALGSSEPAPDPGQTTRPVRLTGNGLIAFHGANGEGISVVGPDGSGLVDLTTPPARHYDTFPAWSPDGSRLAFLRRAGGGPRRLVVAGADGSSQVTLTDDWDWVDPPAWSPDGLRIALPGSQDEAGSLLIVDTADANVMSLPIEGASPSWSSDGGRLAFAAQGGVFTARTDGTDRRRLTGGEGFDMLPTWSPEGEWVAFLSSRGGNTDLYVVRPDGTGERRLTDFDSRNVGGYSPVWSPDGSRIAVEVLEDGGWNIHVVDVATGMATLVTESAGDDISPAWSPDGRWIAHAASAQASSEGDNAFSFDIRIVRPDGTRSQTVVDDAGAGAGLSWQPTPGPEAVAGASEQPVVGGLPEGELYLRTDDGAGVIRAGKSELATASAGEMAYDVSADGRVLMAEGDALISMSPAGRRTVLFEVAPPDVLHALARWAPDGVSAAFSIGAQDPASRSTLCVIGLDGAELCCFPRAGRVYTFDWAADGRAIVTAGPPAEPVRIVDPATGNITEVVAQQGQTSVNDALREAGLGEGFQLVGPTWSPSGRYLAALANLEASRFSYVPVVLTRGGDVVALGKPSTEFPEPLAWSPVADRLAYTAGIGPYHIRDLRLLDPATGDDRLVFSLSGQGAAIDEPIPTITDVTWAPSGRWFAVTTWQGTEQLLLIDVEGGEQIRRIEGNWETWNPILGWMP